VTCAACSHVYCKHHGGAHTGLRYSLPYCGPPSTSPPSLPFVPKPLPDRRARVKSAHRGHVQVGASDGALRVSGAQLRAVQAHHVQGAASCQAMAKAPHGALPLACDDTFGCVALLVAVTACRQQAWVARSVAWCSRKVEYSGV
jgi:hypothetical protein